MRPIETITTPNPNPNPNNSDHRPVRHEIWWSYLESLDTWDSETSSFIIFWSVVAENHHLKVRCREGPVRSRNSKFPKSTGPSGTFLGVKISRYPKKTTLTINIVPILTTQFLYRYTQYKIQIMSRYMSEYQKIDESGLYARATLDQSSWCQHNDLKWCKLIGLTFLIMSGLKLQYTSII